MSGWNFTPWCPWQGAVSALPPFLKPLARMASTPSQSREVWFLPRPLGLHPWWGPTYPTLQYISVWFIYTPRDREILDNQVQMISWYFTMPYISLRWGWRGQDKTILTRPTETEPVLNPTKMTSTEKVPQRFQQVSLPKGELFLTHQGWYSATV